MKILFLLAFGGGLATAVFTMLHGVEKNRGAEVLRPAPHLNLPALAALMVVFGAVGYLLVRNSTLETGAIAAVSIGAGGTGWLAMSFVMAKWALHPSGLNARDEAEEIQGQLARVVMPITAEALGSIRYERNGREHDAPARAITGGNLEANTDVVIDRFDDGIAVVEDWASVEKRL